MEKPISVTMFLHDIGLFVEKYLDAMPGGRICRAWCLIEQQSRLSHTARYTFA